MKKLITVLMIVILAIGLVGCGEEEVIELKDDIEEEMSEDVKTEETVVEEDIEVFRSDVSINGIPFKLQKDSFEDDNLIELFSLSAQEFLDKFEIDESYLTTEDVEKAGTFEGSYYFVIDEAVFFHDIYFTEEEDRTTQSLINFSGQADSETTFHLKLETGDEIVDGMTVEEVRDLLGEEKSFNEDYWEDMLMGHELVYEVEGYEKDVELFFKIPEDEETIQLIGLRLETTHE